MAREVPAEEPTPERPDSGGGDGKLRPARSARRGVERGGPRREYSAGGVVLRRIDGTVHVLLIRDPYRNWGLPKGHVEDGEEEREAALREVREETGLLEIRLGPALGTIDWFFRLDGDLVHKFCRFFAMISRRGAAVPETDEGITECVWVPAREAPARITYDNAREVVQEAVRRLEEDELQV